MYAYAVVEGLVERFEVGGKFDGEARKASLRLICRDVRVKESRARQSSLGERKDRSDPDEHVMVKNTGDIVHSCLHIDLALHAEDSICFFSSLFAIRSLRLFRQSFGE